ncbi:MAG TPA: hypothetical protein VIK72_04265 [Clostridiaceae bacterium]
MGKTCLDVRGVNFYINGRIVYDEITGAGNSKGLLMNSRFIQGVFDDKNDSSRFNRFGKIFDPNKNTDDLIAALPEWYKHGLRAITVGFQGGWPVFTVDVKTIDNNPFGKDGLKLDEAYAERMDRIIRAADSLGIVVIVNFLYWSQTLRLKDEKSIVKATRRAANFLKNGAYTNVFIDLANEHDISSWEPHPLINSSESVQLLMEIARKESGGMLVGTSGGGGTFSPEVIDSSDIVLVHGNGLTRGEYFDFICKVKKLSGNKPVICNEDSPCISRIEIAKATHTSWGHYDNFTKQEPPCDWSITPGQDFYFARRMAKSVGIEVLELPFEDQFYLQGLEATTETNGERWIHLAAEHPERIDHVNFYQNGNYIYTSYDEPFFLFGETTWIQKGCVASKGDEWSAETVLTDGKTIVKAVKL